MINLHESMGAGEGRTCDPWVAARNVSAAGQVTECTTLPSKTIYTFVEIDHELHPMIILLLVLIQERLLSVGR